MNSSLSREVKVWKQHNAAVLIRPRRREFNLRLWGRGESDAATTSPHAGNSRAWAGHGHKHVRKNEVAEIHWRESVAAGRNSSSGLIFPVMGLNLAPGSF